jgi:hypothetical protein
MEYEELILKKSIFLNMMVSDEFLHLDTGCIQMEYGRMEEWKGYQGACRTRRTPVEHSIGFFFTPDLCHTSSSWEWVLLHERNNI